MNLISTLTAITFLAFILTEAVVFHKKTVCRQKVWLVSVESITRSLLSDSKPSEQMFLPKCRINAHRRSGLVTWNSHRFNLPLKGKL